VILKLGLVSLIFVSQVPALDIECDACYAFFDTFGDIIDSKIFIDGGEGVVIGLCSIFESFEVCRGLIELYGQSYVDAISQKYLDPSYSCVMLGACSSPEYIQSNYTQYVREVLADMPPAEPWPNPSGSTFKIVHVTDMHVDWDYKEGANTDCDLPLCCREGTGNAGKWGFLGKCDVPPQTVQAFLDQVNEMEDISFVVWTGDNPPHNIWAYEREAEMDVTRKLVKMFKDTLRVPVYPIIGNHDCFPMDLFKPGHEDILLGSLADLWSGWLGPDQIKQFRQNGFYSTVDPKTNVKILGINNEMGDNMNTWLILNSTDPGNMLAWVRDELYEAEKANQKVIVLGHIPHGGHFSESNWARRYEVIANRFRNTIVGQFFGHTHNDEFEVIPSIVPGFDPAGVLNVGPSFTTYSYHNPSFRVIEFDSVTKKMVNIHQYRLPLYKYNNSTAKPTFEKVYSMKEEYGLPDLSPKSFQMIAESLKNSTSFTQKFYANFMSQYSFQSSQCGEKCQRELYCKMSNDVFDEYLKCVDTPSGSDVGLLIFEKLIGEWLIRLNN